MYKSIASLVTLSAMMATSTLAQPLPDLAGATTTAALAATQNIEAPAEMAVPTSTGLPEMTTEAGDDTPVPVDELLSSMPVDQASLAANGLMAMPVGDAQTTVGGAPMLGSSSFKIGRAADNNCISAYPGQTKIFLAGCSSSNALVFTYQEVSTGPSTGQLVAYRSGSPTTCVGVRSQSYSSNAVVELQTCRSYSSGLATQQWAFWSTKGWLVLTNSGNTKCMKAIYESSTPDGIWIEGCTTDSQEEVFMKLGPAFLSE